MRCLIVGLMTLAFWLPPCLVEAAQNEPEAGCENGVTTSDFDACSQRDLDAADAKLNVVFQKAIQWIAKNASEKPYDAKSWQAALRASQRAWIAYRDADCNDHVPYSWTGGTGTNGAVLGCLTQKTTDRTAELADMYQPD